LGHASHASRRFNATQQDVIGDACRVDIAVFPVSILGKFTVIVFCRQQDDVFAGELFNA
jgi:hypothetical protein